MKGEQELSLEEQERWARGYAAAADEPVTVFPERASAKSILGRPVFQQMIAQLEELPAARRPRALVTTTLDRLSRSMEDTLAVARTLRALKVELYVRDVGAIKADTFAQRAALVGQSMGGEAENEAKSNRIRASWDRRRREGKPTSNRPPYGLQLQAERDVPAPESAEWVLNAFRWYAAGDGDRTIAGRFAAAAPGHTVRLHRMDETGAAVFRTRIPRWEAKRVTQLLSQPRYRGTIVPEDLFDAVQATRAAKPRWRNDRRYEYPFSGAVRCGHCKRALAGTSTATSQRYRYYICAPCGMRINALELEQWFRNDIDRLDGDETYLARWVAGDTSDQRAPALRREIAALERAIDPAAIDAARAQVWELALGGQHASADLERQLGRIAAKVAADTQRLTELRAMVERRATAKRSLQHARRLIRGFWRAFEKAEYDEGRSLIGALSTAFGGCTATKAGLVWDRQPAE